MTKEQEAQQAQTIAKIKERHTGTQEGIELGTMRIGMPTAFAAHHDRKSLLEIVDSQAQKIAEQAEEIDNLSKRGVKKYSEKQAREWYNEYYATTPLNQFHAQDCAIAALKYFGALEEK